MEEFVGAIKSFSVIKGYGFLESPESHEAYGKDIMFLASALNGREARVGETVSFRVVPGKTGPIAADLQFLGESRKRTASEARTFSSPPPQVKVEQTESGDYNGFVKSYNANKGWGFVDSPETKDMYGKDILFQAQEVQGRVVKIGEAVTFRVASGRNGPIAVSLRFDGELEQDRGGDYSGRVKSYNPVKGWGFIECEATQSIYGKDMLFQGTELRGRDVRVGESVSFSVTSGRSGPIAVSLRFHSPTPAVPPLPMAATRLSSLPRAPALGARPAVGARSVPSMSRPSSASSAGRPPASPAAAGGSSRGEYVGSVKSYHATNGWGFIESPQTHALYGKDILFRKDELRGRGASKGEPVAFGVVEGDRGPLAVSIRFLDNRQTAAPALQVPATSSPFLGVVKSFNPQTGWGFIDCVATQLLYGKDIMLLSSELRGTEVRPGQTIAFSVTAGKKGPIASSVVLDPGPGEGLSFLSAPDFGPLRGAPAARQNSRSQPYSAVIGSPAALNNGLAAPQSTGQLCGTVKSFDEGTGWGFIEGQGIKKTFGKDVFMPRESLNGATVSAGDQVSFTYEMGHKGPMATKVEVLPKSSFSEGGGGGATYSGVVKSYNPEKGWGFVTCPETTDLFGKDIFLHKREFPMGVELKPGDRVSFSVQLSGARPEATNVARLEE